MRHIIEVLRLKDEAGLSLERIARACGPSKGVVGKYGSLAHRAGHHLAVTRRQRTKLG